MKKRVYAGMVLLAVSWILVEAAQAQLGGWLDKIKTAASGKTGTGAPVADGLKEALKVGIDKAVTLLGRQDGYLKNEQVRIPFPQNLRGVEKTLRRAGFSDQIDQFILSANRAAESAAPSAKKIFIDAILGMRFEDAQGILSGGDTAATQYLQQKTGPQLREAFAPVVDKALQEFEVTRQFKDLLGNYQKIPFVGDMLPKADVDAYVIDKALEGLFVMLGQEEKKIRTEPAARVNSLLQQVFGTT